MKYTSQWFKESEIEADNIRTIKIPKGNEIVVSASGRIRAEHNSHVRFTGRSGGTVSFWASDRDCNLDIQSREVLPFDVYVSIRKQRR